VLKLAPDWFVDTRGVLDAKDRLDARQGVRTENDAARSVKNASDAHDRLL